MRRILFMIMLLGLLPLAGIQAQAVQQNPAVALQVIAELNQWRLDQGLAPLKPNATLAAMALQQASYVISLDKFPDDPHVDAQGMHPMQRALTDPFDWPFYARQDRVAIGENAAEGNVNFAMNFWHNSDIHRRTALNPAYREVGVAALSYRTSYVIIVDFGARPDVLPALVDPRDDKTIYLSQDQYQYASSSDVLKTPTELQLYDSDGRPLSSESWSAKIDVPADAGSALYILMSDGKHQVLSPVNLTTDRIILPDYLPVAESPEVAIVPTAAATEVPTEVPTQVAPTTAPQASATPAPTEIAPTATATIEATAVPETPDVRIEYNADTMTIMNVSGGAADWSGLEFVGSISFPFTQFSRVADFPLSVLPAKHCLQIRDVRITGSVVAPNSCSWVRSLVQISTSKIFWTLPFDVRRNDQIIATCAAEAGVCEFKLN